MVCNAYSPHVTQSSERSSHFPAIEKRYGKPMTYWFEQIKQVKGRPYPEQMAFLQQQHGFSRAHANALVQYSRGSKSSRRFESLTEYLEPLQDPQRSTLQNIFATLQKAYPEAEVVIAWNQPMLKQDGQYLFGASALKNHILIAPWDTTALESMRSRLTGYTVNKKTIRVPNDWAVDEQLLKDLVDRQPG